MVKFQIASDLHIEFKNDTVPDVRSLITPTADVLILAGDIGNLYKYEQLKGFLTGVCELFQYVLFVPGNHEYYRIRGVPEVSMKQLTDRLLEIEEGLDNLFILNSENRPVLIDNVCIIGCTLWSKALNDVPSYIVRIKDIDREMYNEMHERDLRYVVRMINYCRDNNKKLVVVTHHCPTYKVTKGKKDNDPYVSLYATNLEHLLRGDLVKAWICGHIHRNFDFTSTLGCRVVGNQRGKPRDNITDYRKDMVIEV